MPRLRNTTTGVVVDVDKATAAQLGQGWESADKREPAPKGHASSKSEK